MQTDEGKEFYNKQVQDLLEEWGIHHYSTKGESKAAVVERFNRTLKERTYRWMTATGSLRYLPYLQSIVDDYNSSMHLATGMAPIDVDDSNADKIWKRLYGGISHMVKPYLYCEGDFVRTTKLLGKYKRLYGGYGGLRSFKGAWSREVYTVISRSRQIDGVNYYTLEDWQGKRVPGRFYEPQLQKVQGTPNKWKVSEKIKYRGKGDKRQVLVNWQGMTPEFQTWIPVSWFSS